MRIVFWILTGLTFAAGWICTDMVCGAEVKAPGVIANERVVNLPNDSEKWYLSIVGEVEEVRYAEILVWFEKNSALNQLRKQVHFRKIDSDTVTYRARYAPNVKGLPTVRLPWHLSAVADEPQAEEPGVPGWQLPATACAA